MDTGTKNQLAGAWHRMTGRTQMAAGAQFDDPELFFNGVIDATMASCNRRSAPIRPIACAMRCE